MLYEDVEVVVLRRILSCETTAEEVITAMVNELLVEFKTGYKVAEVSFYDYPREIEVRAEDEEGHEPDEDSLGLSNEGYNKLRELLDSLSDLTGARWVGFPGYYYSK